MHGVEAVVGVIGLDVGGEDAGELLLGQQAAEAELPHAAVEGLEALHVTREAALAPLGLVLLQRLLQGVDHLDRRREAHLSAAIEEAVLQRQVEVERPAGVRLQLGQPRLAADHEGQAGHTLDALVGAGDEVVRAQLLDVDGQPAVARHGVHDHLDAALPTERADLADGVEHARRGLVVDHRQLGVALPLEPRADAIDLGVAPHAEGLHVVGDAVGRGHGGDARPVGPIVDHQQPPVGGHGAGDHRLHPGRPRAAEEHRRIGLALVHDPGQPGAHPQHHLAELGLSRADVRAGHGLLDAGRGVGGPRVEQDHLVGHLQAPGLLVRSRFG